YFLNTLTDSKSQDDFPVLIKKNKALIILNISAFDFVLKISGNFSKIKLRCLSVKSVVYPNLIQQVINA
ncbi:hypothetical protein, partial [Muribaculum intestinale]|uniref:hypothetical protein n=1 Tax=Muribaculum intestinale TaxID=1796646 RepID=UPI0026DEAC6F